MSYKSLSDCVADLKKNKMLLEVTQEVDPYLELAALHRRIYAAGGPAILFKNVKGTKFPVLVNLFGSLERARFLFRHNLKRVETLMALKIDPAALLKKPSRLIRLPFAAYPTLPKRVKSGPVIAQSLSISDLPQIVSWPQDGGAFVTLPLVYSESVNNPGWQKSNLGMYRIQLSGNKYEPNDEIGLHYQLHRGIGVHHAEALAVQKPFRVSVFVGGPPAMSLAAVMPLPEGIPELTFAGALGGRRISLVKQATGATLWGDADFCITGTVIPNTLKPEGPFGDHLGYYSLKHDYPVLKIENVYARKDAIWPHTTVGRPPQEDTVFGQLIHELTGDVIPSVLPGVKAVHAVDAAGVHPLLLALGTERYTPYQQTVRPQEILTQANALLGQGQLSLAKYVFIADATENPDLSVHDIQDYFCHVLERIDWRRDCHFQTETTIDTLDYSSGKMNQGSKLVLACAGPKIRDLPVHLPKDLILPTGFGQPKICLPGVLVIEGPKAIGTFEDYSWQIESLCQQLSGMPGGFPLIVVVDDSEFTARTLNNFLWVVFTRSNPAQDVSGVGAVVLQKHWGCKGSLVIDARLKPHAAPALEESADLIKKVNQWATKGSVFEGLW